MVLLEPAVMVLLEPAVIDVDVVVHDSRLNKIDDGILHIR